MSCKVKISNTGLKGDASIHLWIGHDLSAFSGAKCFQTFRDVASAEILSQLQEFIQLAFGHLAGHREWRLSSRVFTYQSLVYEEGESTCRDIQSQA
jgi:hypothetical protein